MSSIVLSYQNKSLISELNKQEFETIEASIIKQFSKPEQSHADMQIFKIKNDVFVLQECYEYYFSFLKSSGLNIIKCSKKAGDSYPENILLNFLYLNNTLYGNLKYAEPKLIEYCQNNNIAMINVKQGYTRCSTSIINNTAAITADGGIYNALKENGVDVLKISAGNIILEGYEYGFIGGASFACNNSIYFFGNISEHPDYKEIERFCIIHNVKIIPISPELPLTDIGGAVIIH